jgi:hypothetical protein
VTIGAGHGAVRPGMAWLGEAGRGRAGILRQHKAGRDKARCGMARRGKAGILIQHPAWLGMVRHGDVRRGLAGRGKVSMTGHTAVKKGKAVIVFLKDGTQIRGQYAENRGRFIVLADGTRIQKVDLRCVTIDRKQT